MSDTTRPLWQLSAVELGAGYARGAFTPIDAFEAVSARIDAVNPVLNAIVTPCLDEARRAATASAERFANGQALGPLDGVPMTIKDSILMAGCRATWGSLLYENFVPEVDETPVARLREGGAVLLGKTNVPELTLQGYTNNRLFGVTGNPWNVALTPGGSSGGAVAAVASGMGALALCTDGGGSIRRPSAHTGLVGFKPSRGIVPRANGFPVILLDFEVAGPIARSVADLVLAMNCIAANGWHADVWPPLMPLRILHIPSLGDAPVDPQITRSVAAAAARLAQLGHTVSTAESFDLAAPIDDIWPVMGQTGAAWLVSQHPGKEHLLTPSIAAMAEQGARFKATDYLEAFSRIAPMARAFDALFAEYDMLLTPAIAALSWPAAETHPEQIDGKTVGPRGHAVFTAFANALGLPAIALPMRPLGGKPAHRLSAHRAARHRWPAPGIRPLARGERRSRNALATALAGGAATRTIR